MKDILFFAATMALSANVVTGVNANDLKSFVFSRFSKGNPADTAIQIQVSSYPKVDTTEEFSIGGDGILAKTGDDFFNNYLRIVKSNSSIDPQRTNDIQTDQDNSGTGNENGNTGLSSDPCGPSPFGPAAIRDLVVASADKHGVDRSLATAIAWAESRFNQVRNSPRGARGTMQLMPATAQRYGVRDVCDAASNIDGGVRYLRSLIDQFGNPLLAAAAYNAGEQPIYDHHGVPPYPETVAYVAAILNYQLGLQPPRVKGATLQSSGDGDRSSTRRNSVIGATTTAKFVGGVMQF